MVGWVGSFMWHETGLVLRSKLCQFWPKFSFSPFSFGVGLADAGDRAHGLGESGAAG